MRGLILALTTLTFAAAHAQPMREGPVARPTESFNRAAGGGPHRGPAAMATQLRDEVGRNRVTVRTANGERRIDLAGSPHFDKASRQLIPTPHVHTVERGGARTTRPADKGDIRIARRAFRAGQQEKTR